MSGSSYSAAALRRNAKHFLAGRLLSAALGFVILLWVVRALPVREYAAYVTFLAAIEIAFSLSFVGLPWLAARYLPEFRTHATMESLSGLCWRLVGWHALIVVAFCMLLAALLDYYLERFSLADYRSAAGIYLMLFVIDAMGRFAREGILGALLQQGIAQVSLVFRNMSVLILLVGVSLNGTLRLELVAWTELSGSCMATAFALAGLKRFLVTVKQQPSAGWTEPSIWRMWPSALKMYASQLLTLAYSPQLALNMIQLSVGPGAAATFGFLRSLYDLIGRYLPATLLFSLVRPKLVASYVHAGDIGALTRNANLAGKLSLVALIPMVAFSATGGELLVGWLSAGKFADTGLLLFGLMIALVPFSQRQLLETVAVATGHAGVCTQAGFSGLVMPLLMLWMLDAGLGLWSAVIGIGLGHLAFDMIVLHRVAAKTGFRSDLAGFGKLGTAGLAGFLVATMLPSPGGVIGALALLASGTLLGYLLAVWRLQPVDAHERARLLGILKRPTSSQ